MDKKSQHVGDHGGRYTDEAGMSRQFTYVDHDKKTRISTHKTGEDAQKAFRAVLDNGIDEILAMPASSLVRGWNGDKYEQFVMRDRDDGIVWRENMVREALHLNPDLYYSMHIRVWKNTVQEKYWSEDMSHEDILAGKWKEWI